MPTQLRPNWIAFVEDGVNPPPDLEDFGYALQPVPANDQSATIICAIGAITVAADGAAGSLTFSLWDAWTEGEDVFAGSRQIPGEHTISLPAVPAMEDPLIAQFVVMWVDTHLPQSGGYMVAYDAADVGGISIQSDSVTIRSVGP